MTSSFFSIPTQARSRSVALDTLEERIEWLQRYAAQLEGVPTISRRDLSAKAGLNESTVNTLINRHGQRNMVPRAGQVCSALARRWGVSLDWLMNGDGEPFENALTGLDRVLAEVRWSEPTRAAAIAQQAAGARLTEDEWRTWLRRVEMAVNSEVDPMVQTGEYPRRGGTL